MPNSLKLLTGLLAALLAGWIHHGPLGNGARLIDGLEAKAKAAVAEEAVPGVDVALGRDPLSRTATLSGPANDLQRDGLGSLPGLTEIVGGIEGVAAVRWAGEAGAAGERAR